MRQIDPEITVGQLVADRPHLVDVLDDLGIDYCCGGKRTLREASQDKGLDPRQVVRRLEQAAPAGAEQTDWSKATLSQLVDHILDTHHAYMHAELPRLDGLLDKILRVHGKNHPELGRLAELYRNLRAEIEMHLMKEEQVLFPMIRQLEGGTTPTQFHCGSLANPIGVMEHEHDTAGAVLAEMRRLTGDYATPPDGCGSYRAAMDGLARLEADLHQHIHKENNILFPRVLRAEAAVC